MRRMLWLLEAYFFRLNGGSNWIRPSRNEKALCAGAVACAKRVSLSRRDYQPIEPRLEETAAREAQMYTKR